MKIDALMSRIVPILHEDKALLVLAKPSGIDIGGLENQTTPGLLEIMTQAGILQRPLYVTNRLSRFESGILVLGKSLDHAARLKAALKQGRWRLEYTMVVLGKMSKPHLTIGQTRVSERGTRRPSRAKSHLGRLRPVKASPAGSPALTTLHRLETVESRTLLTCQTALPTTHALRAQLRAIRMRVLGDRLHDPSYKSKPPSDTCLHLSRVTLPHPETGKSVTFVSPPPDAFRRFLVGQRDFQRLLQAALVRRWPLLKDPANDSLRLLTGLPENLPGLAAEKLGPVVILQVLEESPRLIEELPRIAKWYKNTLDVQAVYVKHFIKGRERADASLIEQMHSPVPLIGKPVAPKIVIHENDLRFYIKPYEGFSTGLFLDQRDNRKRIREMSAGREVLNLFAYTCGFSVAAAAGGAKITVSVDTSHKALEWGKENFELNDLSTSEHEFFAADAMEFLHRTHKRGRGFDLIILDPPSFAHARKGKGEFSLMEDLADLVSAAIAVLRPRGMLMVSTNHRKMSLRNLLDRIHVGAKGRDFSLTIPPLPIDFAMDADYAKSVFAEFDATARRAAAEESTNSKDSLTHRRRILQ